MTEQAMKRRARVHMRRAIRRGELTPGEACERCGRAASENGRALDGHHHHGYEPECALDVQWLCIGCHARVHGAPAAHAVRTPDQYAEFAQKGITAMLAKSTAEERSERSRNAGRSGGRARANKLTAAQRAAISGKAGRAAQAKLSAEQKLAKGKYMGALMAATGVRGPDGRFIGRV